MFANNPHLVGNQALVDVLKFATEQTIKCVIELELDTDPDATAGQPCPRTAVRKAVIARVTISLSVKPLITE
jgi:hypothetical protein